MAFLRENKPESASWFFNNYLLTFLAHFSRCFFGISQSSVEAYFFFTADRKSRNFFLLVSMSTVGWALFKNSHGWILAEKNMKMSDEKKTIF